MNNSNENSQNGINKKHFKIDNFNLVDSIELEVEESSIKSLNQQQSSLNSNEFYLIKTNKSPTHSISSIDNLNNRPNSVSYLKSHLF
jgi:hypothetical protein